MALPSEQQQLCHHYTIDNIQLATQHFNDSLVIGEGGFGKVYKGDIKSETGGSTVVAIKRLDSISAQGAPEFRAEIEMLSRIRHSHLVSLLGCCVDGEEMIIVYEYMPHGTVYHHLHNSHTPLSWMQRLTISIGAARGLEYLHDGAGGTTHGVIHRDMKSSNILLDEDWGAKISDFGLAKLCPINQSYTYINTGIKGTFGYMDPEIFMTGKFTRKTDVYAFGVVLFELLSGKDAVLPDGDENLSLAIWARRCVKKRNLDQLVAAEVRGKKLSLKSLKVFSQIAYRCLHNNPKERPAMSEVVAALQLALILQEKFDNSVKPGGLLGGLFRFAQKKMHYVPLIDEKSGDGHKKSSENNDCSSVTLEDDCGYSETLPDNEKPLAQNLKKFSYTDLECATKNFQNQVRLYRKLVFLGWVQETTYLPSEFGAGLAITVEKLLHRPEKDIQLLNEFSHPNLPRLLGYCFEDGILYLVHEFMEKRSLADYIYNGDEAELSFITRIKIVVGVARGLAFLQRKRLSIRDCRLDMDEIWLDKEAKFQKLIIICSTACNAIKHVQTTIFQDFNAKLICFDVSTLVSQSVEHMSASISIYDDWINRCDVHGLGMLLMEVLTIRSLYWAQTNHFFRNMNELPDNIIKNLDSRMKLDAPKIERARELASLITDIIDHHYTIAHVLEILEKIYRRMTRQ